MDQDDNDQAGPSPARTDQVAALQTSIGTQPAGSYMYFYNPSVSV